MDKQTIEQVIIESIIESIKTIDGTEIDQFIEGRILIGIDSLVGVNLICILEKKLGITLPDDFLTSENCSSLKKIVDTFMNLGIDEEE